MKCMGDMSLVIAWLCSLDANVNETAVGRLALTNYLLHSVILTTVFYGYGLGLYGEVPRFWQMGFVVAVVGLQLVLSPWWLARYRFGPVEWFGRSLTYWQRQPMRRE